MATPSTVATYALNNSQRDFDVTFDYLSQTFVQVSLIGATSQILTLGSDFTFLSPTVVRTTLTYGPPDWTYIEVRRATSPTERLVEFNDAAVLHANELNLSDLQVIHIAEEARNAATETIGVDNDGNLDARGRRIVNLADPVGSQDAISLSWYQEQVEGTHVDRLAAEATKAAAESALVTAVSSASAASASQGAAASSSVSAANSASSASASSASALTYRNDALLFRTEAETFKNSAGASATSAGSSAAAAATSADEAAASAASVDAGNLVHKTGDESIDGIKTFTSGLRLPSSSLLGIGTSSPQVALQLGGDGTYRELRLVRNVTSAAGQAIHMQKGRGTESVPTSVVSGDMVGSLLFSASDGTAYRNCAQISAMVNGSPSVSTVPCELSFATAPGAGSGPIRRMTILPNGRVRLSNNTTDNGALLQVDGTARFSGVATFDASPVLPGSATTALQAVPKQQLDAAEAGVPVVTALSGSAVTVPVSSGLNRFTVCLSNLSTSGTSPVQIRLGTSGGVVSSGYKGSVTAVTGLDVGAGAALSTGVTLDAVQTAANSYTSEITFTHMGGNLWAFKATTAQLNAVRNATTCGHIALAGELTQFQVTTAGGANTFDAGVLAHILHK